MTDDDIPSAIRKTAEIEHIILSSDAEFLDEFGKFWVSEVNSEIQNEGGVVTGELIANTKVISQGPSSITVGNTAPHAVYYEYGRGPVEAKNAKALRFTPKDSAEPIFRKRVGPADGTGVFMRTTLSVADKMGKRYVELQRYKISKV